MMKTVMRLLSVCPLAVYFKIGAFIEGMQSDF